MKLSSDALEAFYSVALKKSFSEAALSLCLTQSAISQRISKLESELEQSLFIRDSKGLLLTEQGELLFQYCHSLFSLEEELLNQLNNGSSKLSGRIRIGTYSSILRSVVMPTLAPLLRDNPQAQVEFYLFTPHELEKALKSSKVDLAISDAPFQSKLIQQLVLGEEEFVFIENRNYKKPRSSETVFLDFGPEDNATKEFLRFQGESMENLQRKFMGDVYGIIEGVRLGLGVAIMSKHLVRNDNEIRIKKSPRVYKREVICHFPKKSFYSDLHKTVVHSLQKYSSSFL